MSAGFGFVNKTVSKPFAIPVSDQIDYEISFWWQQPTRSATFELSVDCFDCQLQTELIPIDIISGASQRVIIPGNKIICGTENRWNFMHAIVYNCNQSIQPDIQPFTSHAQGTNLIMKKGTSKIFVNLICVNACMLVWDFKFKPLRTPFSTGFIQSRGLIEIWRKNNKKDMTQKQIDTLATQYLISRDTSTSVIEL